MGLSESCLVCLTSKDTTSTREQLLHLFIEHTRERGDRERDHRMASAQLENTATSSNAPESAGQQNNVYINLRVQKHHKMCNAQAEAALIGPRNGEVCDQEDMAQDMRGMSRWWYL